MITGLWVKALILFTFSFFLQSSFSVFTLYGFAQLAMEFSANPNHFRLGNTTETISLALKVRS